MRSLLFLFILVPIVEMWLLITVGGIIGPWLTIGLVLLTACIGLLMLRYQGTGTLFRARAKLQANELPAREVIDTLFYAIGGALLLTPGFVTDAIGFACLTPGIRTLVIHFVVKHVFQAGRVDIQGFSVREHHQSKADHKIIEGDFEREDK